MLARISERAIANGGFRIPIDSSFALAKSWPLFQVHVSVPKTADNPLGLGWTYAHERKGFFLKLPPRRW